MITEQMILKEIAAPLLSWYDQNKRQLPWRDQNNAYYTWVSEIMLQQTRVEAVKPYFLRFINELPDIDALACYPEDKLLKLWEGLGYYTRVRNMQKAAMEVQKTYGGVLPKDYQALCGLKGIGSYTAGAIASIAYGIPVPAVDGNVLRVLSRLLENEEDILKQSVKKRVEKQLKEVIPSNRPGDFNQALMELGAVVCIPNGRAECENCPLAFLCRAYVHNRVAELPKRAEKRPRSVQKRTILIIRDGENFAICRRPMRGLLAGLYEPMNLSGHLSKQEALEQVKKIGLVPIRIRQLEDAKHIFSHVEWRMIGYQVQVEAIDEKIKDRYIFINQTESKWLYPIPSAYDAYSKYWKENF